MVDRKRKHNFDEKFLIMLGLIYHGSKLSYVCKCNNINKMTFYKLMKYCMKEYDVNTKYELFVKLHNAGLII